MLVIRFFRTSKKNQPFFKIVVTEKSRPPRGGRFVEEVGFYNPLTKEKSLKPERIKYWFSKGAKSSDRVFNLLIKEGILQGKKIPVHKKKKNEAASAAEAAPAEKPAETGSLKTEKPEEKPKEEPSVAKAMEGKEKPSEKIDPHTKVDKE